MKIFKKAITVLTLSTLGLTFTASAGPIVTAWDWVVDNAFTAFAPPTNANPALGVLGINDNTYWSAPTTLIWGSNASSLALGGVNGNTSGTNLANGALTQTTSLTHNNFVINGASLTSATLSTRLLLDPNPGVLPFDITPPALTYDISFLETNNDGSCEVVSPIPCNDIFVIDGSDFSQPFMYDGNMYNVELLISGLEVLSNTACTAAGAAEGCLGFTTVENASNTFAVDMRITAVPEPSTILLLSLAMFGIVMSVRSKRV
ncbi:THxN family PEP-CTERM protein [Colwellia ponticola]|uniref:PEP-CTERM sorting domain-containing protein n=1 Tax=Colwellia ponticola TaxID=2304625 RepID=A0A8H2JJY6_9GAMM|nr:THxN family PEP-CTERM protein [Colwellia ponticola]TMM43962.1 PEP-CTERM sorting domain-containing protein [Colwellia ponticola]